MTENGDTPGYATCGAARKHTGAPCTRPAGWGTDHPGYGACKLHGGCTPSHVESARRAMAQDAADHFGIPVETTPDEALLAELHRSAGMVAYWQAEAVAHDKVTTSMFGEQTSVYVRQLERERRHLADLAATCVKLGLDERRVRAAEQMGQVLVDVLRGVLSDLGVADRPETAAIVRRHLELAAVP